MASPSSQSSRIVLAILREIAVTLYMIGPALVVVAFLYLAAKWGWS